MTLENTVISRKQCRDCKQWFDKASFPPKSARCKGCLLAKARELSRRPDQVQKRKERRANRTPEQIEAARERGRQDYANRTPEKRQRDAERRQLRKEQDNARARELRAQSPERRQRQAFSVWKSKLKQEYGITPEIYQMMYEDQGGQCYFCGTERPIRGRAGLGVDHNHDKGFTFIRGLLCRTCNANFIDEYQKLPEECRDFPRANDYLLRGETTDYIDSIRQRVAEIAIAEPS